MEKRFQRKLKMILGVQNIWLQDILTKLTDPDRYELTFRADLCREDLRDYRIAVVDIDDYPFRCRQLFRQITSKRPGIGILAIVSEPRSYGEKIIQMGANAVVGKDELVERFAPVLAALAQGLRLEGQTRRLLRVKHYGKKEKEAVKKTTTKQSGFFKPISRRSFLAGSAATMAALALSACTSTGGETEADSLAQTDSAPETTAPPGTQESTGASPAPAPAEEIYYGSCRANCFGGCRMKIKVRDSRIVGTSMGEFPDPRYNRICAKGLSHVTRIYDPDRLKSPLKRAGERGAGQWEQITWEEAIQEITDSWKTIQSQYGDSSVAFMSVSGCFGHSSNSSASRLNALMGGTSISACMDNNVFTGTTNAFGIYENYNGNELTDLLEAKTILMWGANPCDAQIQNWKYIRQAQMNGSKIICIDPNYTTSAARSDIHVPVKPGSDGLLALAMCNIVVEKGWIDETFLKTRSVAPFLVKEDGTYLRMSEVTGSSPAEGEADPVCVWDAAASAPASSLESADPALTGSFEAAGMTVRTAYDLLLERIAEYTPERAARECEIAEELIYEITEVYATNTPSTLYHGFGPDHYTNGHAAVFAACCLAILTGNVGKVGASAGYQMPLGFYFNGGVTAPEGAKPVASVPILRLPEVMEEKSYLGQPLDLHSIYVYCGNPIANVTERKRLLEAFDKMDLVVVADITMGDTAQYADIVLPVAHWFEIDDMHGFISQVPYLILQEKAMEPLYESKSDLEIIKLLGNAMGFEGKFDMTAEEWMTEALDSDYANMLNISYERLKQEKVLRYLPTDPYVYGESGFMTATGRAQFYQEHPAPNISYGQQIDVEKERLPYWEAPAEAWTGTELAQKYPLIFGQERPKYRVHTQWSTSAWMNELDPEPVIKINPADAEPRGIAQGDMVRAYNDRGFVVLKAVISNGTRPGMIVVPKGWQKGQFADGHYQDMTAMIYNEASLNNCFYDARVEVEKI